MMLGLLTKIIMIAKSTHEQTYDDLQLLQGGLKFLSQHNSLHYD